MQITRNPPKLYVPGKSIIYGSGCEIFAKKFQGKEDVRFDQTPFYFTMAELEKELKLAVGITQKIKMAVAQMLIS